MAPYLATIFAVAGLVGRVRPGTAGGRREHALREGLIQQAQFSRGVDRLGSSALRQLTAAATATAAPLAAELITCSSQNIHKGLEDRRDKAS
jgi:hypothetical protein